MERCRSEELLKSSNTKFTDSRNKIMDKLLACDKPVTANQLHNIVSENSSVDLATVYRSLKIFTEKGLARQVNIDNETVYYEKSCKHNPLHAHFYCEECGDVECLNPFGFDESTAFIKMAEGKEISKVELVLKGKCSKCVK